MKSVKLKNLDCANCALKIEKKLNELEELNNVSLNFSTATLSFDKNVKHDVLEKIEKEIQKIEKDVIVIIQIFFIHSFCHHFCVLRSVVCNCIPVTPIKSSAEFIF